MKQKWKRLAALVMVVVLAAATCALSGTAWAENEDASYSLTVGSGIGELAEANMVLDIYQVAAAVKLGYDYEPVEPFGALSLAKNLDADAWDALAQQAAGIALAGAKPVVAGVPVNHKVEGLSAGLYLVLARNADETDESVYVTTIVDEDGSERIVTSVTTEENAYIFAPVITAVPGRAADDSDNWVNDVVISLKPEKDNRLGSLEIVKNLTDYVYGRPATFVFQVEATLDGEVVYSNVVSLSFTSAGQMSELIEGIPAGAHVTVTEVYSGVTYQLVSSATEKTVIKADDVVSVSFTNSPKDSPRFGGSITNQFSRDGDGWVWTPAADRS